MCNCECESIHMWTHAHVCACGQIRGGVSEWLAWMDKGACTPVYLPYYNYLTPYGEWRHRTHYWVSRLIVVEAIIFVFRHFCLAFVHLWARPWCALIAQRLLWSAQSGRDQTFFEHACKAIFILYLLFGGFRVERSWSWSCLWCVPGCGLVKNDVSTYSRFSSWRVVALVPLLL